MLGYRSLHLLIAAVALIFIAPASARAQSFGVELHNTLMPASGAMGGTSIARPQDPLSAINGNPASLSHMSGTNFTFAGSLIDATMRFDQQASFPAFRPLVTPFQATSSYPASVLANIGVTQELEVLGNPTTAGLGFFSNAGAGVDFAGVSESNGSASSLAVFEVVAGVGTQLTETVSAGASFQFGTSFLDAPFVGIGRNTLDYAARGSFGVNYEAGSDTTVGAYYQTKQNFEFKDAILLELGGGIFTPALDIRMDLPQNFGIGVANSSLMDGNLLLAADVLWKNWSETDLFGSIYDDQWVLQLGAQWTQGRYRWRAGYAWAENPIKALPGSNIGGVFPGTLAAAQFVQAQLAVINEHRISGGVGIADVLPGIDLDLVAGGMFHDSQDLGSTIVDLSSYWLSFGLTWHFGGSGSCGAGCGTTCGPTAMLPGPATSL